MKPGNIQGSLPLGANTGEKNPKHWQLRAPIEDIIIIYIAMLSPASAIVVDQQPLSGSATGRLTQALAGGAHYQLGRVGESGLVHLAEDHIEDHLRRPPAHFLLRVVDRSELGMGGLGQM